MNGEFKYSYHGRNHVGRTVVFRSLRLLQDADEQQVYYRQMMKAQQSGRTLSCWVNPDQTAQAVLFRNLPPLAIVAPAMGALVFAGIGVWSSVRLLRRRRKPYRPNDLNAEAPGPQPAVSPSAESAGTSPPPPEPEIGGLSPDDQPPTQQIYCYVDEWGNRWVQVFCWPGFGVFAAVLVLTLAATASLVLTVLNLTISQSLHLLAAAALAVVSFFLWRATISFIGSCHLRLDRADLHVVRDYRLFSKHRAVSLPYIQTVEHVPRLSRGRTPSFSVYVRFADGRSLCVAHGIAGEEAARWLVHAIMDQMPGRPS